MVFAVNHFGPFLLTNLLLDRLKTSTPSRIVNVSSCMSQVVKPGEMHFATKDDQGRVYPGLREYAGSKLANRLFTKELARQLEGSGITAYSLHPGAITTNILRTSMEAGGWSKLTYWLISVMFS